MVLKQNTHSCKYTNTHQLFLHRPTLQPNWDPQKTTKTKDLSFKPIFDAFSSRSSTCRAWDCKNTSKCPTTSFRKSRFAVVAPWTHSMTSSGILVMVERVTRDWRSRDFATWGSALARLIELLKQKNATKNQVNWAPICKHWSLNPFFWLSRLGKLLVSCPTTVKDKQFLDLVKFHFASPTPKVNFHLSTAFRQEKSTWKGDDEHLGRMPRAHPKWHHFIKIVQILNLAS